MGKVTYRETFKVIVYVDNVAVGSIKKHPSKDQYRFVRHGGGVKCDWVDSIGEAKAQAEGELV